MPETSRDLSFCAHTIHGHDLLEGLARHVHHGSVHLQSGPGAGTTVRLILPRA